MSGALPRRRRQRSTASKQRQRIGAARDGERDPACSGERREERVELGVA